MSQPKSSKQAAPPQDAASPAARAASQLLQAAQQWLEGSMQQMEGVASEGGPSNHAAGRDATVVAFAALSVLLVSWGAVVWTMRVLGALLRLLLQCLLLSVAQELVRNWIKGAAGANTTKSSTAPKPFTEGATAAPAQEARADQEQDMPPAPKELPDPPCALIALGGNRRVEKEDVNQTLCTRMQHVQRIRESTNGTAHDKNRLVHLMYRRRSPVRKYGRPSMEADVEHDLRSSPALYFEFVREARAVCERYGSDMDLVLQKKIC